MSYLYPRQDTLHKTFASPAVLSQSQNGVKARSTPYQARPELYGAWSVVDDAKDKANKLGAEATKEFEKASAAAQSKAGKIELYSGKYYAACTFGGLMACVSLLLLVMPAPVRRVADMTPGSHTYRGHSSGSGQDPTSSRLKTLQGQLPGLGHDLSC